jgi:TolB-like protein/DNA-binding SARP family transcriptional activator
MSEPLPTVRVLRFESFELDVHAGELRKRGVKLRVRGQPLKVLAALLLRAGDLVTREELRAEIWHADTFVDFDHSLDNAIARLRDVLGDSAEKPRYIETLPRRGYRFIGRVDPNTSRDSFTPGLPSARVDVSSIRAIAVLPLEDLSGVTGHEYVSDGMTEALINSLAKIKALRVISRTSAMHYKRTHKSLPEIARELNVDAVVEGSVLRSGERVRITVRLIHSASDQHLWAEAYERDFLDLLSLQTEISRQVAREVSIVLTPEESESLRTSHQVSPEAYESYLKARYYWNKRSEEGVRKALSHFRRAIDIDPTYAQGYAGLADCYNILGYYNALSPMEAYPKAKSAALKALQLDGSLAEPHATLGVIKRDFEWDWAGSEAEFQRAIELNPGYVEAYHWRSTLLGMMGRKEEALVEKARALTMDPLSVVLRTDLARMLYFFRDYDRSIHEFRSALDMDPNFASAHLWLAHAYQQKGLLAEALSELKEGLRLSGPSTYALAKLGHGYALAGLVAEARSVLDQLTELSKQQHVSPYDLAMIHVGLGEMDEAFSLLELAYEQRSLWLGYLNVEPNLDMLRFDARFHKLLSRLRLLS